MFLIKISYFAKEKYSKGRHIPRLSSPIHQSRILLFRCVVSTLFFLPDDLKLATLKLNLIGGTYASSFHKLVNFLLLNFRGYFYFLLKMFIIQLDSRHSFFPLFHNINFLENVQLSNKNKLVTKWKLKKNIFQCHNWEFK